MVKFTTDLTGYVANASEYIRGLSPLHDSGTGSSLGTYGNFEIMPLLCPGGFETCTTSLAARQRLRKPFTDDAAPGYFSLTLNNDIKMEATPTRRAGLERFTFPSKAKPYFAGRITIGGRYGSSFGPGRFNYQAFACYDLHNGGKQKLDEYGVWTADNYGLNAKGLGLTRLNLTLNLIGGIYQSGALFSLTPEDPEENVLNIRVGISFRSVEQACSNAESEVGSASFEEIRERARGLWQEKLKRIEIDVPGSPPNITQMFYSSLYRSFLTPNNATDESQGPFAETEYPYFDSLYCRSGFLYSCFRTFFPLLGLHSPQDYAQIVETYVDGWRKLGWMPECRANNLQGWTQGGSSADNIVGHFAMHYYNEAEKLGVDIQEAYAAMVTDAEVNPPEKYGYVPFAVLDTSSTGRQTREGSRTLEYAFEDFALRQVALLLEKPEDVEKYTNMSLFYRNIWDESVVSDGYKGFFQKRFSNGTFAYTDPTHCSPNDKNGTRPCSLQGTNVNGFYESSSWEYSFFAPHDTAYLIKLMGGNDAFVKRLDHFFDAGYYLAGNEPSFQTPVEYHYANRPTKSVQRVREVVFQNFGIGVDGLPGNDDQAAMATLLAFHILGLYPVPSSTQYLILSPMVPKYTIHNEFLGVNTTVRVVNYDAKSVAEKIPKGASAYVKDVTVLSHNGSVRWSTANSTLDSSPAGNATAASTQGLGSRCHLDFYDTFRLGGEIVITLTDDAGEVDSCAGTLPDSLSTGGWGEARK
ncbi:glycosyl hydrolase [Coprinopsis sp. MPI-PUGE-AT-0042]|nr:glycosyl hydrolase [Coprinopsis sp. MPI-PUGE-AT-0042]